MDAPHTTCWATKPNKRRNRVGSGHGRVMWTRVERRWARVGGVGVGPEEQECIAHLCETVQEQTYYTRYKFLKRGTNIPTLYQNFKVMRKCKTKTSKDFNNFSYPGK